MSLLFYRKHYAGMLAQAKNANSQKEKPVTWARILQTMLAIQRPLV